jgi:hypothetical protein
MTVMQIDLSRLTVSNNQVQFKLDIPKPLKKYFLSDSSYVQYDSSIDLSKIHNSILAIPIVSVIAPVSWAVGADIVVPELDATYLKSLKTVKEVFRNSHYPFSFSGDIRAEAEVTNEFGKKRTAVLFSGGVDSLTSYLKHKNEKPDLISICGLPDIPPFEQEFWSRVYTDILDLANCDGIQAFRVKTDMLMNLNRELLSKDFGVWWYPHTAVGLFLLSLCAPVTAVRGTGTIHIASGLAEGYQKHTGTSPSTDNKVSWADVNVIHDSYELSRQEKMRYLCQKENLPYLAHLRVCNETARASKTNCGNCEKCMRTMISLLLEGIDPNRCNFTLDARKLRHIRDSFIKGRIRLSEVIVCFWRDMQKRIPEEIDTDIFGSKQFFTWFRNYDLSRYRESKLRSFLWEIRYLFQNKRIRLPYMKRKIKCYYFIILARLKLA